MLFLYYPKCSTCKNAKKYLDAKGISYTARDIKEQNPNFEEIKNIYEKSNLPLKQFFNTSGLVYKNLNLKDKLPTMTQDEQLELLATNGMLIKRPILVSKNYVLVGFKENIWQETIN